VVVAAAAVVDEAPAAVVVAAAAVVDEAPAAVVLDAVVLLLEPHAARATSDAAPSQTPSFFVVMVIGWFPLDRGPRRTSPSLVSDKPVNRTRARERPKGSSVQRR
jgi:hypothetical protein